MKETKNRDISLSISLDNINIKRNINLDQFSSECKIEDELELEFSVKFN
jgi:hypothetical protein